MNGSLGCNSDVLISTKCSIIDLKSFLVQFGKVWTNRRRVTPGSFERLKSYVKLT